ncbi:hypothetical protein L1887_05381 [Cichorium endivia]|nr:hypothetical protein L1887_05381 [Cichorium endivia]
MAGLASKRRSRRITRRRGWSDLRAGARGATTGLTAAGGEEAVECYRQKTRGCNTLAWGREGAFGMSEEKEIPEFAGNHHLVVVGDRRRHVATCHSSWWVKETTIFSSLSTSPGGGSEEIPMGRVMGRKLRLNL